VSRWQALGAALALVAGGARAESLYGGEGYRPLTADHKARRPGDVLTVQIFENATAASSTDTSTQRSNAISGSIGSSELHDGRPMTGQLGFAGSFDGGGTTQRTSRLLATVSVSVRAVLPNGDLLVMGEQLLTINEERHRVTLEGRVRPQDVSADNVVLSTRLADARIDYDGAGHLSERTRRPWWRKVLDWVGF
jgi:flagellar L-ring protein precursor FlgH